MSSQGQTQKQLQQRQHFGPLMTVQELSILLQIPVGTIYQWRFRRQGPPSIRVGRFLRYDPSDVDRWLERRRVETEEDDT